MVFSTPLFCFYFLVLTLAVYYVVPRRWRNGVLLVSSLVFYYWGEPELHPSSCSCPPPSTTPTACW